MTAMPAFLCGTWPCPTASQMLTTPLVAPPVLCKPGPDALTRAVQLEAAALSQAGPVHFGVHITAHTL